MKYTTASAVLATLAICGWVAATRVSAADLPLLKDGDIIFQTSTSRQSAAILLASRSAYSHMGLIEVLDDGSQVVIEAVNPVRITPLNTWIKRGLGGRIAIKRFKAMNVATSDKIVAASKKYLGQPYDIFFLNGADEIYCSELVQLAYATVGLTVGKVQKVRELDIDNFAARKLIKARWQKHPLCSNGKAESENACFEKILDQELITPVAIAADSQLELIYSNFGPATK